LATTYKAFQALSQRGKGGVYQAFDLTCHPPRLCILKEGRKEGEVSLDGRDGRARIAHEAEVLRCLRSSAVNVPEVYALFEAEGNHYLVLECIDGESLQHLLQRRIRKLTIREVLDWGLKLSSIVASIHEAGWAWRDCKPGNLIVTRSKEVRPIDFEGACRVDEFDEVSWSTPSFYPARRTRENENYSHVKEDVYAIGAVLFFMISGKFLPESTPASIDFSRRNVPESIRNLLLHLLDETPAKRPNAAEASVMIGEIKKRLFPPHKQRRAKKDLALAAQQG
jgi:serine/threonine protein kinase